jgi:DNA-binding MarR family transcriptional regulator
MKRSRSAGQSKPTSTSADEIVPLPSGSLIRQWADTRPDVDIRVLSVIVETYRLGQAIENEFRAYSQREFGLGTGDVRILLALRRSGATPPLRATDLFQSLLVSSGAVTKQIDRLERQGYVRRDRDPKQKNQRLISLTASGRAIADKAISDIVGAFVVSKAIAALPAAEVDRLIATIERLLS